MRPTALPALLLTLLAVSMSSALHAEPPPSTAGTAEPGETQPTETAEPVAKPEPEAIRDGKLFDPGVSLLAPAEKAPAELARLSSWLGDWHLEMELHRPGGQVLRSTGRASMHFMNRGHAVMERARIPDFDGQGHAMHTMTFFAVDGNGVWTASEGNSWTESITVASGAFEDGDLVLHAALRPGGGPLLLHFRRSYRTTADGLDMQLEVSRDVGATFSPLWIKRYRRAAAGEVAGEDFLPTRADFGEPSPDRAPEAGQFDFLVGDFEATHWLLQGERELRWRSRATAVHALGGHAILEFDWHDRDPSLPDAATTILRLYNRSMRRWESLFLPNRSNSPLYFGGVQEQDRIVLHPFDAQTGANPLFQWIFYGVQEDAYRWQGLRSDDRGSTWNATWTIDFKRRAASGDP